MVKSLAGTAGSGKRTCGVALAVTGPSRIFGNTDAARLPARNHDRPKTVRPT